MSTDEVCCFGINEFGQLGRESTTYWGPPSLYGETILTALGDDDTFIDSCSGWYHSCVLFENSVVKLISSIPVIFTH